VAENRAIGAEIGRKLRSATGPVSVMFPLRGVSAIDRAGGPFDDPAARDALLQSLREHLGNVEMLTLERHINDTEFAIAAAKRLLELMQAKARAVS
jgi:uncharacterized protein (UPF0261 family)